MKTSPFTTAPPPLLVTPPVAAQSLAISERKLWAMTASGEIPHIRIGRSVRYSVAALDRWIADHSAGGETS